MHWIGRSLHFPNVEAANAEGVVAVGGDYHWRRLLLAYRSGIFPWSNDRDPIMWWAPDPRFVLYPERLRVQKSMRPLLNRGAFTVTYDTAFREVIVKCATVLRDGQPGTWITPALARGYAELHDRGYAHSVEARDEDGKLVGGLYGVAIGRVFCGESMYADVPNASKYAFITLVRELERRGYWLVDCQMKTPHLARFGGEYVSRKEFTRVLERNAGEETDRGSWTSWGEESLKLPK